MASSVSARESPTTSPILAHRHVKSILSEFVATPTTRPSDRSKDANGDARGNAHLSTCRPWDSADYHTRLDSFKIFMWFAKPGKISPAECARFGWKNTGVDRLECVTCRAELAFPPDVNAVTPEGHGAVLDFHERLNAAHSDICPWRDNASSESFADPCPPTAEEAKSQFVSRAQSILAGVQYIPEVLREIVVTLEASMESPLADLVRLCDMSPSKKTLRACALAACGWERPSASGDDAPNSVTCRMCGRMLGLWNFRGSDDVEEEASDVVGVTHVTATDAPTDAQSAAPLPEKESGSAAAFDGALPSDGAVAVAGASDAAAGGACGGGEPGGDALASDPPPGDKDGEKDGDPVSMFLSFPSDIVGEGSRGAPDGGAGGDASVTPNPTSQGGDGAAIPTAAAVATTPVRAHKRPLEESENSEESAAKRRDVDEDDPLSTPAATRSAHAATAPALVAVTPARAPRGSPIRTHFGVNPVTEHRWACPWVAEWKKVARDVALVRLLPRAQQGTGEASRLKDAVRTAQRTLAMSTSTLY